ncbi:MAG: DEAD/DEAH box helicase [Flavobacteriaceae bacterium]|nr:DEAD/DEAH box helicase [Flavobacteriaceae bacterium]
MSFKSLGLSEALLKAVAKKGYTKPSPIQEQAIPPIIDGRDVLASAQTGTGKTASFTLPLLHYISENPKKKIRPIRALILTPTRELAAQVYANVKDYSAFLDLKSAVIFGGVNQRPQIAALRSGVDVLVATPGRLLDLHGQKAVSLKRVEIFVLDEADRMLDMGFLKAIESVINLTPNRRQNLLFSATYSKEIKRLAHTILKEPIQIDVTPENSTVKAIAQMVYRVAKSKKTALVIKLINDGNWHQVLVFTRTKHGANRLAKSMANSQISASAIHGNKSQNARTKALKDFKSGKIRVLVATDIAARGLDIPLLPHVVNFELPNIPEDYVHRIGRTGRAGAQGEALSLVCTEELDYLKSIEKLIDLKLSKTIIEGFEPQPDEATTPPKQGQNRNRRHRNAPSNNVKKHSKSNNNQRSKRRRNTSN